MDLNALETPSNSLGGLYERHPLSVPAPTVEAPPKASIAIWTIQMARWRLAKERNIFLLDITVKSGVAEFAPSWECLRAYKQGTMPEDQYTAEYLERMSNSKERNPKHWARLSAYPRIALACYCPADAYCHRHLFKALMALHINVQGHPVVQMGELG
jgi:uncharacterized protein YeaO (DUF488 family)